MVLFRTFAAADEASKKVVKDNPGRIVFIMNKNGQYAVVVGWDGRDRAIEDGWRFR